MIAGKSLALLHVLFAFCYTQSETGTISGFVYDSQTGRTIPGAVIAIDGQSSARNVTNSDGGFSMAITPGTYDLRFSAPNYIDAQVASVVVRAGRNTEASTVMSSKSRTVTIEVVEKMDAVGATAEALLTERKLAPTVSDAISREELSAGTSSNAAGALEKVTGVSVAGEGFVYVRGLGERYSATMLNGAMIPTTEPEKRVVPLDLFPTGMIENIRLLKSYTPDLPAEFAGGLVQLTTIEFPAERVFRVEMKSGFNTRTTFDRSLSYPGGSSDFFGFGAGSRGLPSIIPADSRLFPGNYSESQLQTFGRAFSDNWQPTGIDSSRPALDWSALAGGTFGRFGIVGAVSLSNGTQTQSELQRYYRQGGQGPVVFTDYPDFREYSERARLGGILNLAVRLSPSHKLVFRNTLTHEAEKSAREFSGYDGGLDSDISSERLRYIERSLFSTSVEGSHFVAAVHNSVFRWQMTYSRSTRDEPDLREVLRSKLSDGRNIFSAFGTSGIRFFSDLHDRIYEPQADFSVPFFSGSVSGQFKVGYRATLRSRDFGARRFRYIPQQTSTLDLYLPSNQLFAPANIRPSGFQIVEYTRGTDSYTADMNVHAGYAMVDMGFGPKWRVVAGVRMEASDIGVKTVDNRVPNAVPQTALLANTDPAPGVNLIYALTRRQNLRFSYSRTLSRPDFRELSPFDFSNVVGGFVVQGNPDLKRAVINNYDARWEAFLGASQMIAASFFTKTFIDPIEQTILPSNDLRETFVNAKGARNVGVELELRKNLGSIHRKLRTFGLGGNFTFVDSKIDIRPEDAGVVTSTSRPLLGQSRYIWNMGVEWVKPQWRSNARLYFNNVSRRLSDVGTFRLPDIYQEGNSSLDLVYQLALTKEGRWNLRFEAENLTDNEFRWTQGDLPQRSYRLGRTFQVGLSFSVF